jgi:hypothetical protein
VLISWICHNCKTVNRPPEVTACVKCNTLRHERYATVRTSQRAVVDYNHLTGQYNVPMRADAPMHAKQAQLGYERIELNNWSDVKALESQGLVHEPSNYNSPQECKPMDRPESALKIPDVALGE